MGAPVGDVATALRALVADGSLDLPLPRGGHTRDRWRALERLGRGGWPDAPVTWGLSLARVAEGHTDAVAILAEAGCPAPAGATFGVWASRSVGTGLVARREGDAWTLSGTLRYCSGAPFLDAALVPVSVEEQADAGPPDRLVLLRLPDRAVRSVACSWRSAAMADAASLDVEVDGYRAGDDDVVGPPGFYQSRPGFWVGGIGVAAVWLGGARAVLDVVRAGLSAFEPTPHQLAHLGAMSATLHAVEAVLDGAAATVDARPDDNHQQLALTVRHLTERAAVEVIERAGRITGPTPLARNEGHAQTVADLAMYVRQNGAERDLERLGRSALAAGLVAER